MCYRFFIGKYFLIFMLIYRIFIVSLYRICTAPYLVGMCT
jgi:hypothetical protein